MTILAEPVGGGPGNEATQPNKRRCCGLTHSVSGSARSTNLAAELELVKYAGSQLELRVKIELEPAQTTRIVYVPLPRRALSVLKEYEFTLPVWDEGLLHALRRWGVEVERDDEKALLPLLPSLAARWSDKPKDYRRHLTASGVRARLFDDEQVHVAIRN